MCSWQETVRTPTESWQEGDFRSYWKDLLPKWLEFWHSVAGGIVVTVGWWLRFGEDNIHPKAIKLKKKWRFLLQNLNINRESHGSNKKAIEKCEDVPFHRQDRRVEAERSRIKDCGRKGEGYHYSISSSSLWSWGTQHHNGDGPGEPQQGMGHKGGDQDGNQGRKEVDATPP